MDGRPVPGPRGRGTGSDPENRFTRLSVEPDYDGGEAPPERVSTRFYVDGSRTALARNDSPDVGFAVSLNPYRGCEHGCVYCYARPTHEYLGFSAGLDFETRIMVKEDAPELLRRELASPAWEPQTIAISGVTDAYQPIERRLAITRRCLAVLAEFGNPVAVITKNALVRRDADLLGDLARQGAAAVSLSITSLDPELQRRMEPRTSPPAKRLEAIAALVAAGIPVSVMVAPVVPGLTDHEIPAILAAAARAGARSAGFVPLRLPGAVAGLFEGWLAEHYPDRRQKVLARIRELRGGRLNDPRFGSRMRGEGIFAEQIAALFHTAAHRHGLDGGFPPLSTAAFRRPTLPGAQLQLFG
ncbi:MAG TPA: PA0069 family radical SAM protein [Thermoanaerobaculia bacterium]